MCNHLESRGEQLLARGIVLILRAIRQQRQLSLREVEERGISIARERGNQSYQVSASWLYRLEREEHKLTVNKLIVLAEIYNLPPEQLLRSVYLENPEPGLLRRLSVPNATIMLSEGPLDDQARYLLSDTPVPDPSPDETALLTTENGPSLAPYRRGIIGKRDLTLDPMIPAGSIVQIDTWQRAISPKKDWKHEFHRPIYFLMSREGYVCGWCELDKASDWLTVIPAVACLQPKMEVPDRNRKHRARYRRGYSIDRMN
jgi:transcriptional regulator with XRE-family HTH domain